MTKYLFVIMALVALSLLTPSGNIVAQQSTQQPQTQTKQPSTQTVSAADKDFAMKAAEGGMAEVALGELATKQAANDDVKQFGQRMVTDHGKANNELKDWASKKGVTLPSDLNAKHKALQARLSKLSGAEFDREYIREMVKDHDKDTAAFDKQSRTGRDPELKAWAAQTLPTLREHQKMAKDLAGKVGATTAEAGKSATKSTQ